MKIRFTRTPPAEYAAYVEGETAEISEQEARHLVGLGVAAHVSEDGTAGTKHVSNRTEIVGAGNETEVVLSGRGASIAKIMDPKDAKEPLPGETTDKLTDDQRKAVSRAESVGLVRQEANRQGGPVEDTAKGEVNDVKKDEPEAKEEGRDAGKELTPAEKEEAARKAKKTQSAPETK